MPKSFFRPVLRFFPLSALSQFWNRVASPFVERSLRGRRGLTWAMAGLAIVGFSFLLSIQIVHSPSPTMRDWRQSLALESDSGAIAWSQCGFCVALDEDPETYDIWSKEELLTSLSAMDSEQAEICVRRNAAEAEAYASGDSKLIERITAERDSTSICPGPSRLHGAWSDAGHYFRHDQDSHLWQQVSPDTFIERRSMIVAADFMPTIETYHSPLHWSDLPRVWTLLSGYFLMLIVTIVAPTAIVLRVGREMHEETFAILRATQIPPTRILAGLIAEALTPWLLAAAPSLLVITAMATFGGNWAILPGTFAALLLVGSIGSVFAFMLALAASERIQAGLLAIVTAGAGLLHGLVTMSMLQELFRHADRFELYAAWPSLWAARNLARVGEVWPSSIENAWHSPSVLTLWALAAGILSCLAIAASRRLRLEARPASTLLNWTILSTMVGGGLSFLTHCDHSYGGHYHVFNKHFMPAWLLGAFALTLISFYRSPLRPRLVLPLSPSLRWRKDLWLSGQILFGLAIMTSVLVLAQQSAYCWGWTSRELWFPFSDWILPATPSILWFVICGSWCMLWLSGGIQGFRAHLGLGLVAFVLGGMFLRLMWFTSNSSHSAHAKPSFFFFEGNSVLACLQFASLVIVPIALHKVIRARTGLPTQTIDPDPTHPNSAQSK